MAGGKKFKLTFHGGTGDVTGANFLFETVGQNPPIRILIDCGLFQGGKIFEDRNYEPFPYDPASIDYLFVTHAHLDHVGRIPRLVRDGFRGVIYSTPPTKDIAELMLIDSMGVMAKEAETAKKPHLYNEEDVAKSMGLWKTIPYYENFSLSDGMTLSFLNSGHILGSALVVFTVNGKKFVFTGDLGNTPAPLLRNTDAITDANFMLMESVYGDRNHEDYSQRKQILEDVIEETMLRKGVLMIPAFSLERTQELLYEIQGMMEQERIPLVPVFVDSPLAIKVTSVYEKYASYFNHEVKNPGSSKIFEFPQLHFTLTTEESKNINKVPPPKIILAGSGMSNGGRILHHEKLYLPDPNSTLLLAGYQAVGTLGRRLREGERNVKIMGEYVHVRARVANIHGYSAHKDSNGLVEFVASSTDSLEAVYVCMGEPKSSLFLVQRLRDYLGLHATAPELGSSVEVEL